MQKKVLAVSLCCMALPYLYWYVLAAQLTSVHIIGYYIKNYGGRYLYPFGSQAVNNSILSLTSPVSTLEDVVDLSEEEDVASATEEEVAPDNQQTSLSNKNVELAGPPETLLKWPSNQTGKDFVLNYNLNKNVDSIASPTALGSKNPPLKKILFWNKNFGLGVGRAAFLRLGCPVNTCTVTNQRTQYSYDELDAVIWHERSRDASFPPKRSPHTRYVFMLAEPPGHVKKNLKKYKNIFNWTLTYRWDSDIPMRIGQILPLKYPGPDTSQINYAAGKTKMAVWFVSNCGTDSGRGKVAKQLKKYFEVDVYGKCGPFKCRRFTHVDCYKKVESHYKFYLSFENSLCRDYVTEKFFKVLLYNMVPVVYGGANYSAIAPEKSYINVRDFPSIEALANYLLYLNSNDTAYNEYFWWKRHYEVLAVGDSKSLAWCQLCERLHTDNTIQTYPDLHDWYIRQARCQTTKYKSIKNFING